MTADLEQAGQLCEIDAVAAGLLTSRSRPIVLLPRRRVPSLTVDGTGYTTWDEAFERELQVSAEVSELLSSAVALTVRIEADESTEDIMVASTGGLAGRLVRSWTALDGMIRLRAEQTAEPYGALKLLGSISTAHPIEAGRRGIISAT